MLRPFAIVALVGAVAAAGCRAPAALPATASEQKEDKATAARLRAHVRKLSQDFGPRCGASAATYVKLEEASLYIQQHFELLLRGAHDRTLVAQRYVDAGKTYTNVALELGGSSPDEIVVVGAHYDSACAVGEPYTPGADDNASGVAALLELARRFDVRQRSASDPMRRTLRFVAFANEEAPYFQTTGMGSVVYAQQCQRKGEAISAMLSIEMLGYFSDESGSQRYPYGVERLLGSLPERGDFIAVVGNLGSRRLVFDAVEAFRRGTSLPAEGLAAPLVRQLGWSDNSSFWQFGYAAVMVTDTAMQRNPNYHLASDTWETLDYRRMSMAVDGLAEVIAALTGATVGPPPQTKSTTDEHG